MSKFTRYKIRGPAEPGLYRLRDGARGTEYVSYFDGSAFGDLAAYDERAIQLYRDGFRHFPSSSMQWSLVRALPIPQPKPWTVKVEYILVSDQNDKVVLTTGDLDELRAQATRISDCGGECTAFQRLDLL